MSLNDRFLRACWREPVDATPVWFMRQAGRYLPGYRQIRRDHSFLEMARSPDLSAAVTLLAVRELDVDAAILFADIALPLAELGFAFDIQDNVGPVAKEPLRTPEGVGRLRPFDPASMPYIPQAIRRIKERLDGRPLIGFSAAPFTLASYMIEGRPSKDFAKTKTFMWTHRDAWDALLSQLAEAMAAYLRMQVEAGADALQVFDTWAGCLSPDAYEARVQRHVARLFRELKELDVPTIHFGTGTSALLRLMRDAGGDVVGVDWRLPIGDAWDRLGQGAAIQGNLDPAALLAPREELERQVDVVLEGAEGRAGHIFNLGHGILPETPAENARLVVKRVREKTAGGTS